MHVSGGRGASRSDYKLTIMDTLGGAESRAMAIDSHGKVLGWAELKTPDSHHAVTMEAGKLTDIGAPLIRITAPRRPSTPWGRSSSSTATSKPGL